MIVTEVSRTARAGPRAKRQVLCNGKIGKLANGTSLIAVAERLRNYLELILIHDVADSNGL
jgi:hypothetical protein